MRIVLTALQRDIAFLHADRVEDDSAGRQDRGGARGITREESRRRRRDSSCGELAASLALGVAWHMGFRAYGKPDIGRDIDVGTRPDRTDKAGIPYGLRYPAYKNPEHFHQLVVSVEPYAVYDVLGGLRGREILEHPEWKSNPFGKGPVYWVPREYLKPYA
jgi:hypothetical protein